MKRNLFTRHLIQFSADTRGSVTVESVIVLPLLVLILVATFVFHDMFGFKNVREKATYTIADMIARETQPITPNFLDNAKTLFDTITGDNGTNALRVSLVTYDADTDSYAIDWSQVRGSQGLAILTTVDVQSAHNSLPSMTDGEALLVVDSSATYGSVFDIGQGNPTVTARVFQNPRFAPRVVFEEG